MIDGQQFHLIEIYRLFQRLHESEAELAIFFSKRAAIKLDGFSWTRNITFDFVSAGLNPMPDDARAQHVSDKLIFVAIPSKKRGTRTAAAVKFSDVLDLI